MIPNAPQTPIWMMICRWSETLLFANPMGKATLRFNKSGTSDGEDWDKRNPLVVFPTLEAPPQVNAEELGVLAYDPISEKKGWICISLFSSETLVTINPQSEREGDIELIEGVARDFYEKGWHPIIADIQQIKWREENDVVVSDEWPKDDPFEDPDVMKNMDSVADFMSKKFNSLPALWWDGEICDVCGEPNVAREDTDLCHSCGEPKVYDEFDVSGFQKEWE